MGDKPTCPVELKPMAQWVQEEDPLECRPCMLAPVAQWYRDELNQRGHADMATSLVDLAEKTDVDNLAQVLTLCQKFDTIKDAVEEPLRERLKDFDCAAQAFDPTAQTE